MYYSLLDDYKKFEKITKKHKIHSKTLDLSKERFLAPTTLIPLLCYAEKNNIHEFIVHPNTEEYIERILNRKQTSTTTPYQVLPRSAKERQEQELSLKITEKLNGNMVDHTLYIIFSQN